MKISQTSVNPLQQTTSKKSVTFDADKNCYNYSQSDTVQTSGGFSSSSSSYSVYKHNPLKEGGITGAVVAAIPAVICAATDHMIGVGVSLLAGGAVGAAVAHSANSKNKAIDQAAIDAGYKP